MMKHISCSDVITYKYTGLCGVVTLQLNKAMVTTGIVSTYSAKLQWVLVLIKITFLNIINRRQCGRTLLSERLQLAFKTSFI